jgi:ABC-type Fe3+/spermidine/putrescine transport system ATPase subunit
MAGPVLELIGIDRVYRTAAGELPVLKGTDLRLNAGELVGLVGPSGSGKSTLLHTAGLLERPEAGKVMLDGIDCLSHGDPPVEDRLRLPVPPPASRIQRGGQYRDAADDCRCEEEGGAREGRLAA